ncbi:hypothetical protein ACFWPQ_49235 [Streptomyces sp. NPDC058464]|uniref:hypothetical protein n=1 Tax=Streptomyces sp. NPDC058464 TaxID=3346511 RepID=UPI003663CB65
MSAHHTKRAFACLATGLLLAGGSTAISTASSAAAAAPAAANTLVFPSAKCAKWHVVPGYWDGDTWHKAWKYCTAVRID